MNIIIPDQDTFRRYRSPADIEYGIDRKTPIRCQYKYYFPNGYGASVVQYNSPFCCDTHYVKPLGWELAVIMKNASGEWHLCYDTPITDDVIPYLTGEEVCKILEKIICLPRKANNDD